MGGEMYLICRGEVEVLDTQGQGAGHAGEGDYFGEISLLLDQPRTASVRAKTLCDLFVLSKTDFERVLKDYPRFEADLREKALTRHEQLKKQGR